MKVRYLTVDVFTEERFGGNPLAVVLDAEGLDDRQMQLVAREFNYSETTFVLPASDPEATHRVRIFTPLKEMPFAGHPTIGTAFVLAAERAEGQGPLVFEEGVGRVSVALRFEDGRPVGATLTAATPPVSDPRRASVPEIASALSLSESDLAGSGESWSAGLPMIFVRLRDREALRRARFDPAAWNSSDALREIGILDAVAGEGEEVFCRVFAPGVGVVEDPATGSAAAALPGLLARERPGDDGTLRWVVTQGVEMGRPSRIAVEAERRDGRITEVRVGGSCVRVAEGTMEVGDRSRFRNGESDSPRAAARETEAH